jgi:hypothetical protein
MCTCKAFDLNDDVEIDEPMFVIEGECYLATLGEIIKRIVSPDGRIGQSIVEEVAGMDLLSGSGTIVPLKVRVVCEGTALKIPDAVIDIRLSAVIGEVCSSGRDVDLY